MEAHTTTINGLLTVKPGNTPKVGEVETFAWEQRVSKNGNEWIKIKRETPEYGGKSYRIVSATQTDFVDAHKNISFNLEIEPANGDQQGEPLPTNKAETSEDQIPKYAAHSARVFTIAWNKAQEIMGSIPTKDAEEMKVWEWYDLRLRIAQGFAIEINKILRKERF